jgi:hypothetical protein
VSLSEPERAAFFARLEYVRSPSCTRIELTWPEHEENSSLSRAQLFWMPTLSHPDYCQCPSRRASLACAN